MTPAQRRALETLLPRYGLHTTPAPWDFLKLFGRDAPRTLEIGFGNGNTLLALAQAYADQDFIGIEVHRPGVGYLLNRLASENLANVRVICDDALEVLTRCVPDASLDTVLLYFPDPWPKKRHHKRRLMQPEFVALLACKLKSGGLFRAATDWTDYAEHMSALLSGSADFINATSDDAVPQTSVRPLTKFEQRGMHLGHPVCNLAFRRR
ncbi:MAG: tRNA (guanosine(46)-N7)-methyltransferase TrmB [Gammaproteobacteria bacterium]